MSMKLSDMKVATALLIHGYLRSKEGDQSQPESHHLHECLGAIQQEVDDWEENLEAPRDFDPDGNGENFTR